jgi:hypothetical protein
MIGKEAIVMRSDIVEVAIVTAPPRASVRGSRPVFVRPDTR